MQRVQPLLAAHGRLLPTQDAPYKANVMKLTGNFMLFGFVNAMSEAFTLADTNGIPRADILAFIDAFFPAPPIQVRPALLLSDYLLGARTFLACVPRA